jgi:uncharacterized coiled-coil protein SlyX
MSERAARYPEHRNKEEKRISDLETRIANDEEHLSALAAEVAQLSRRLEAAQKQSPPAQP